MSFEHFDTLLSTMDMARENVVSGSVTFDANGAASSSGVLADHQTAGRGQRGRVWHDRPGESLCLTTYFREADILRETPGLIALIAGAAVAGILHRYIEEQSPESSRPVLGLKWPNDILLNDKKLGGVLIEIVRARDGNSVALVGIGINLAMREFPPDVAPLATSLLREGLAPPEPKILAGAIVGSIAGLAQTNKVVRHHVILTRWREFDATIGRRYETEWNGAVVQGVAAGIDESGALLLNLPDRKQIAVQTASSLRELPASL